MEDTFQQKLQEEYRRYKVEMNLLSGKLTEINKGFKIFKEQLVLVK